MAEPSAQDRRRLRTLENRLEKASEDRKRWTAERKELRRQLTKAQRDAERSAKELQGRVDAQSRQVNELVAQNRDLSEQLEAAQIESASLEQTVRELRGAADAAQEQADEAVRARRSMEQRLSELEKELPRVREQLAAASEQLREGGMLELLPAGVVADLVSNLIDDLGTPRFRIREGELRLSVALGAAGQHAGFVVPTPEAAERLRDSLQHVVLRFDRPGGEVEL